MKHPISVSIKPAAAQSAPVSKLFKLHHLLSPTLVNGEMPSRDLQHFTSPILI
jgi:hypothetical protein